MEFVFPNSNSLGSAKALKPLTFSRIILNDFIFSTYKTPFLCRQICGDFVAIQDVEHNALIFLFGKFGIHEQHPGLQRGIFSPHKNLGALAVLTAQ